MILKGHLRETEGKIASLNLTNGLTGQSLVSEEVDANRNSLGKSGQTIMPLESGFFLIEFKSCI